MNISFKNTLRTTLMCGVAVASMPSAIALAEEAASDAPQFEEIVVTSRKKKELLTNVPMNIAVVGSAEISKRNLINKEDFFRTVAGAAAPRGQLILRGVAGGNDSTPDTTSVFVDGVVSSSVHTFSDLFDVERVEVLRGPQGTLWGSNAIGGTVQVITNKPNLSELEVFGATNFKMEKNRNGIDVRGYAGINIPLVEDKLALRIAGSASSREGKMYNTATGTTGKETGHFIRAQLLWQASEDLSINFGFTNYKDYDNAQDSADRSVPGGYYEAALTANPAATYGFDVEVNEIPCTGERSECFGAQLDGHDPKFSYYERVHSYNEDRTNVFSLNIVKDNIIEGVDLTYTGSYQDWINHGRQGGWSRLDADDMFNTWIIDLDGHKRNTHELRLQNNTDSAIEWTVGAYYDKTNGLKSPDTQWQYHDANNAARTIAEYWWGADPTQIGIDLYGDGTKNYNVTTLQNDTRELALFGEASYTLDMEDAGKLEFTAGLRYYDLQDEVQVDQSGIWIDPDGAIDHSVTLGEDGAENGFRKKFGVAYMPSDDLSVFAIYSEGYRPGGNNGPSIPASCVDDPAAPGYVNRYQSDQIKNYEIGVKGFAVDRRVQFSAAVYRIDWTGVQTSVYMADCGFSYLDNAGTARSEGIEFESTSLLTDGLKLILNGSYTKSRFTEADPSNDIEAGEDMTMVPKYNFYAALDQEFELYGREASVRAEVASYGETKSHFDTKDKDISAGYTIANISGGIQLNDNARMSIHVNNLFNKDYTTFKRGRSRGGNPYRAQDHWYGDERTVAIRFDFKM